MSKSVTVAITGSKMSEIVTVAGLKMRQNLCVTIAG